MDFELALLDFWVEHQLASQQRLDYNLSTTAIGVTLWPAVVDSIDRRFEVGVGLSKGIEELSIVRPTTLHLRLQIVLGFVLGVVALALIALLPL